MTVDPEQFKRWTPAAQERALEALRERTRRDWRPFWCMRNDCDGRPHDDWTWNHARADQRPPLDPTWLVWLLLSGRGSGKTRTGAEYLHRCVARVPRVAVIGGTAPDARDIMIEGEALALDTPVPTPTGWTTMGQLEIGDEVFGVDGTPTKVRWVSNVDLDRPCYRVTLRDGTEIVADAAHKWLSRLVQPGSRPTVRTTARLHQLVRPGDAQARVVIERAGPLDLPDADLAVPPYTLGAWLGDGHASHAAITTMDPEVLTGIIADGFGVRHQPSSGDGGRARTYGVLGLQARLRLAGLWRTGKRVPPEYLRASFAQRLDLLRGLIDTDGTVSARGQVSFDNTNHDLCTAVVELCATLAIPARCRMHRAAGPANAQAWRVTFTTGLPVTTVRRKLERLHERRHLLRHHIVSVHPVRSVPVRCIAVDADDHLFLVGRSFVPTHNSGLVTIAKPDRRPAYEPSKRRLTWPNGAVGTVFSAEEPDRLRGPEHYVAWWDEPAHAPLVQEAWDNLMFGLRLGAHPRVVLTTTPRPRPWLKDVVADADTRIARASTFDNIDNLAPVFAERVIKRYQGTRLGRQELHGEILEDVEGALWRWDMIEADRHVGERPDLVRTVVAIDPAGSQRTAAAETAIIAAGRDADGHLYPFADRSGHYSPHGWALAAIALVTETGADAVIAERNYGGDMVESQLRLAGYAGRLITIHARHGKDVRAEPVVGLYEQHLVHHVGDLSELEEQLCSWVPYEPGPSPDRLDALVYALIVLATRPGVASMASPVTLAIEGPSLDPVSERRRIPALPVRAPR